MAFFMRLQGKSVAGLYQRFVPVQYVEQSMKSRPIQKCPCETRAYVFAWVAPDKEKGR
ncbi:hypothetical protein [Burkholderia pseudomallei]|uniref:hypothetical protein n=1 Tax=Burkholderia pseudomallei TaxID=28450 RepID=UPI00130EEC42|nr:hypothetical protein [Burkholderia pseudomallei]MDE3327257.1 hypothetical protein [Burkholderia pseudomallei]